MVTVADVPWLRGRCAYAVDVAGFYANLATVGLEYGPGFRAVHQLWRWAGGGAVATRLHARMVRQGTLVHPADLDGALQASAAVSTCGDGETRLPFAVDAAVMRGGAVKLWAGVVRQGVDALSVSLGGWRCGRAASTAAQLDGFKARTLKASVVPTLTRYLYATAWQLCELGSAVVCVPLLLISGVASPVVSRVEASERSLLHLQSSMLVIVAQVGI